jgi:2-phospho-L-lactate guanylyltransferase (CobY/MobA/RfbA family)
MATVVVPFRSTDPKRRLGAVLDADRVRLAQAMLADVLAAAAPLGTVLVVAHEAPSLPTGMRHVPDPHHGQGAAAQVSHFTHINLPTKNTATPDKQL